MIKISGDESALNGIVSQYHPQSVEKKIIDILSESNETYSYASADHLQFELKLRKNIIDSSRALHRTSFSFKTFRDSTCNPDYWQKTDEGGFMQKDGVKPSDAIRDIYINSREYGTECATAMVIVYLKALVDIFPEESFNELFSNIYLMNWLHLDSDLGIGHYKKNSGFLPGDCRYFKNPDVDPLTPEWQGENVIDLGDGTFYGHGIGIGTGEEMIFVLNKHRIEGSEVTAYLMDSALYPDFKYLAGKYHSSGQL